MARLFSRLFSGFTQNTPADQLLRQDISRITGWVPQNLALYRLALRHTSASLAIPATQIKESNERLEYLGDAVLGAVVADYLFRKFPYEDEGFLTDIRSRIVNRESLNQLAQKLGIDNLIIFEGRKTRMSYKSMNGDALEAFVGAVYLDRGFRHCYHFIIRKIITVHLDLDEVIHNNKNFKSLVIEWAQKENRQLRFEIVRESGSKHRREFVSQLYLDNAPLTIGTGFSKKKAEQAAAEKACQQLKILGT
ncbi:MAG: ribonuclease III [Microscillaceae bacterium]|nr:ribonuclease III [Microscillaceae bacterium]